MHHLTRGACRALLTRASMALALLCLSTVFLEAQAAAPAAQSNDLDAFMARVLARRDVNRQTLQQYILDDDETFEILGPGRTPLHRGRREFAWYVRDGMHVRSPIRFDGVTVGEEDRRKYEDNWVKQERERLERRAKRDAGKAEAPDPNEPAGPPVAGETPMATPRFVSEAYFMDFKFEAGNPTSLRKRLHELLLLDEPTRARMGAAGRRLAEERFGLHTAVVAYEHALRTAMEQM